MGETALTMRPCRSIHDSVEMPLYSSDTFQARSVSWRAGTQRPAAESRRALSGTISVLSASTRTVTSRSSISIGSNSRTEYSLPGAS